MVDTDFLVYMYMREDGTPYYVGKGRPRRPYIKTGRPCPTPPKERIVIYRDSLDEKTAFELEKELIAKYGRKDLGTGILRNRSEGGEGYSGYKPSEETIKKTSGKNHYNYVPRDWYHPKHGEVLQKSTMELIRMFPEQKLHNSELCHVVNGKKIYAKGWCLLENRGTRVINKLNKPRDWYHPDHGEVLQKSCSELSKMFPEQQLNRSTLSLVAIGGLFQYKKWRSLENKDVFPVHKLSKLRDWYHPDYGEVLQTSCPELVRMFPEQKLLQSSLSDVANGKRSYHKGWVLLENKDRNFERSRGIPRDWFHPEHGEVLQKSCAELVEMFPEQDLVRRRLSRVATGKRRSHRGWTLVAESVES